MIELATGDPRDRAVDALLDLAATRPWSEIGLGDIAMHAELTLKDLRSAFPSKGAILGAFSRRIDLAVLSGDGAELLSEPPRERVFDVLLRRFEQLRPYRPALRSIRAGVMAEPLTLVALNGSLLNSMNWMLAYAGVPTDGPFGAAKAQGLALLYGRSMLTFLEDDDPALARTMRELDEQLRSAEPWIRRAEDVGAMLRGLLRRRHGGQAAEVGPDVDPSRPPPGPSSYSEPPGSPLAGARSATGDASDLSAPV